MLKKIAVFALVVIVVATIGLPMWAQAALGSETVRSAIAAQLSSALGQPVTIGGLSAGAYPRITVKLADVTIGGSHRMHVDQLALATNLGALFSRRIEHASVRLSGARIELPLPAFAVGDASSGASESSAVQLVSVDELLLRGVEIVSGGQTVTGDVDIVPENHGLLIRRISLRGGGATMTATGRITDLAGPAGELTVQADTLNFDQLLSFATDFSGAAATAPPSRSRSKDAAPNHMNLDVALHADRARMGTLALDALSARARMKADSIVLEPIAFGLFGGKYEGTLTLKSGGAIPAFRTTAHVSGIDVASVARFAGSPDTVTGRLSGRFELAGHGSDVSAITRSTHGTARIDIVDGVIRNLGLVHAVVVATSMRTGSGSALAGGSKDEAFSRLGATLTLGGGSVATDDLRFDARDLTLDARGAMNLAAALLDLRGNVQLSEALSQQAGRDLVRYTQDGGRVTLPATVTGPLQAPHVAIDTSMLAKRALANAAAEQLQKKVGNEAVRGGLLGLFKR